MAPERQILCGVAEEPSECGGRCDPVRLRMWEPGRNVDLRIADVRRQVQTDIPSVFLDLLDIAVYVYCADQAVGRGGDGLENLGASWRRNFAFKVPVRNPEVWASKAVYGHLVSTLSFLSEDEYRFEFVPLTEEHPLSGYFDYGKVAFKGTIDDVVMFSGGADSLAGAVQEAVTDRRKVLLVNHRSSEKLTPRFDRLLDGLRHAAGDAAPLHAVVRINKAKYLGRDTHQRTRSFLFAALGATFAAMSGLDRLRFYENGVVSLNLPPSAQVVGARASRTTHPRVLDGLSRLVSELAGRRFTVENPFQWKTKADVIRLVAEAGCGPLIGLSTSCGHTWTQTAAHPHCGDCSQCIDRRLAVLAAGQEAHDPEDGYAVPLLTGERPAIASRLLLAAYLETANRVSQMGDAQFLSRFGEVSRVLRHVEGRPEDVLRRIAELYRRYAAQVNEAIDRGISRNASNIRQRTLPPTCLLRLVCDASDPIPGDDGPAQTSPPRAPHSFRREGQAWMVRFQGGPDRVLRPSLGAAYLHALLTHPGRPHSAAELATRVSRRREEFALGSAGDRLDRQAVSAYRARWVELQAELAEARRNNDSGAVERVQEEMNALAEEIRAATGAGGRIRLEADDTERVRKAVGTAIRRAIRDIGTFDAALAAHLDETLQCGRHPCYNPPSGTRWET